MHTSHIFSKPFKKEVDVCPFTLPVEAEGVKCQELTNFRKQKKKRWIKKFFFRKHLFQERDCSGKSTEISYLLSVIMSNSFM